MGFARSTEVSTMREAYRAATADTARKTLRGLVSWLEAKRLMVHRLEHAGHVLWC